MTEPKAARFGLLRSGVIVSAMTFLSRILGLVRDVVIAFFFGASAGADAFFLAFKIPNFFRRLFAEGAFSQAFVPVLSEYKQRQNTSDLKDLIDHLAGALSLLLFIFVVLGVVFSGGVITIFAFGYVLNGNSMQLALAGSLLSITFPYLALISLTAFAGSILNTFGRFAVPAVTPVLLNICLIVSAVWLSPYFDLPVFALAWGVFIAGWLQLLFQWPSLARLGLVPRPRINFSHPGVKRVGVLMLPALLGVSVGQINLLLDTMLATFLQMGSISWLYYSDRLLELPLALFGIAIATVILPALSRDFSASEPGHFSAKLDWGIRMVLLFGLPATVALVLLADQMIATIFHHGQMTDFDVAMAGLSLKAYGAGLVGHMMVKVLAPGYFARQDMKTPVRIGLIALSANMVFNLALILHLGHVGLALATSMSAFLNAFLLWRGLIRRGIYQAAEHWGRFLVRIGLALSLMGLALFWLAPPLTDWLAFSVITQVLWMAGLCLGGMAVYFLVLRTLGLRITEFRDGL
ncbi:MAG: murein biosynthesis integral membrane protein MurJ [Pseudomonadales bacterium]